MPAINQVYIFRAIRKASLIYIKKIKSHFDAIYSFYAKKKQSFRTKVAVLSGSSNT